MEASSRFRLDLGSSWSDLLTAPEISVSHSGSGRERVLHDHLSTDGGFLGDVSGPSPVDEVIQDSIWSPSTTEGVGGYPGWFGLQQLDEALMPAAARKVSSSSWCDNLVQPQQLTSTEVVDLLQEPQDYPGYDGKVSVYSSSCSIEHSLLSPMDERFEFGDVSNVGIAEFGFQDEVTSPHGADYVDTQVIHQKANTLSDDSSRQANFFLGDFDDSALDSFIHESLEEIPGIFVPDSIVPVQDSLVSHLDTLDDDDSLHDAESVCQLLRALDAATHSTDFLRGVSPALNHFSPEEVESVLSRESSSNNLAGMDVAWADMEASSEATVESPVSSPYTIITSLSAPVGSPTIISVVPSSCSTIDSLSGIISASSSYMAVSQPFLTIASPTARIVSSTSAVIPITSTIGQEYAVASNITPSTEASVRLALNSTIPSHIGEEYLKDSLIGKQTASSRSARPGTPGYNEVLLERRQRKKEQNKSAALKYRQRKREEKGHAMTEVEELEMENEKLKKRSEELSKEINYLRGLLEEITRP